MKSILMIAGAVALSACSVNSNQPTAWVKPGVSKVEYGNDIGMCTGLAAQQNAGSGVNTAGGISGANNIPHQEQPGRHSQANENGQVPRPTEAARSGSLPAQGTYSGMVSADYASRAANQQRTQEMLAKKLRAEALRSCLVDRGYSQVTLSAEQRARLASLDAGGSEYHEYLYKIASESASAGVAAK